jgi:hypothetical protein
MSPSSTHPPSINVKEAIYEHMYRAGPLQKEGVTVEDENMYMHVGCHEGKEPASMAAGSRFNASTPCMHAYNYP